MDLGATICTPRNPICALCPLRPHCIAFANGTQTSLPRKTPKPEKPTRTGVLWVARNAQGHYLTERRPDRGLLGGMIGFPGTDWDAKGGPNTGTPPLEADWRDTGREVTHTFSHFHLRLTLHTAVTEATPTRGSFAPLIPADLPTLMRKAHDLAQHALLPR
jgi:A/G-specific adenine glycosylase